MTPMPDNEVRDWLTAPEREAWDLCSKATPGPAFTIERRSDVDAAVHFPEQDRWVYVSTGLDPDSDAAEPFGSEGWRLARAIAASINHVPAALRSLAEARRAIAAWREGLEIDAADALPTSARDLAAFAASLPRPK